jgi:hypothetical protein
VADLVDVGMKAAAQDAGTGPEASRGHVHRRPNGCAVFPLVCENAPVPTARSSNVICPPLDTSWKVTPMMSPQTASAA